MRVERGKKAVSEGGESVTRSFLSNLLTWLVGGSPWDNGREGVYSNALSFQSDEKKGETIENDAKIMLGIKTVD